MTRRTLDEGIGSLTEEARDFVHGTKAEAPTRPTEKSNHQEVLPQMVGRKPLTIKLRPEVASELKRVAIMSQLSNERLTMQDIAEEAIEAWLKKNAATSTAD